MQNIYPLFKQNRILKKELLWSLRDYTFAHLQLEYQEYGPGILLGCKIKVREDKLVVGPGMIKYRQFIILLMEEATIPYKPAEQMQYLKIRAKIDDTSPDYILYQADIVLENSEAVEENEFELCRFNLRAGARLRDQYTDFYDIKTEYDTINIISSSWSGPDGSSLSSAVTGHYSKAILSAGNCLPEDRQFAYLCLSQSGALPRSIIINYIKNRLGLGKDDGYSNEIIYEKLCGILKTVSHQEGGQEKRGRERNRIIVDD